MPVPHSRIRPVAAAALGVVWLAAAALTSTQPTEAAPGSVSAPVVASFAPVWPGGVVADEVVTAPVPLEATTKVAATGQHAIVEGGTAPVPTGRPAARQPRVSAGVATKTIPTSHAISGIASWYCKAGVSTCMSAHPDGPGADLYAAAGPGLRRAMCGSESSNCWRGRTVLVNGVMVVLADWCGCSSRASSVKLIDLYWDAWARIPSVADGVTIRW